MELKLRLNCYNPRKHKSQLFQACYFPQRLLFLNLCNQRKQKSQFPLRQMEFQLRLNCCNFGKHKSQLRLRLMEFQLRLNLCNYRKHNRQLRLRFHLLELLSFYNLQLMFYLPFLLNSFQRYDKHYSRFQLLYFLNRCNQRKQKNQLSLCYLEFQLMLNRCKH